MRSLVRALFPAAAAAGVALVAISLFAESPAAALTTPTEPPERLTVEEARGRSRLLHATYEATLHTMHRRYFDIDERHAIPARALEDVFKEVDAGTGRSTRWISVNTPAMNVDHEPRDDFEKQAAEALGSGKEAFERVENGIYHRASPIKLGASCLKCHVSGLTKQIKTPRLAGFVVSMPVETK